MILLLISFNFVFAVDNNKPVIESSNVVNLNDDGFTFNISAVITDNVMVESAVIEIETPSLIKNNYSMVGNWYYVYECLEIGVFNYKIYAYDNSSNIAYESVVLSRDRNNYFTDNTTNHYIITDGIVDDIAINSSIPNLNDNPVDYGWWYRENAVIQYDDTHVSRDYLSIGTTDNSGYELKFLIENVSFSGTLGFKSYIDSSTSGLGFYTFHTPSETRRIFYHLSYPNWVYNDGSGYAECNENNILRSETSDRWVNFMFAFNGTTDTLSEYIDDKLCHVTSLGNEGLYAFRFVFRKNWIDEIYMTNGNPIKEITGVGNFTSNISAGYIDILSPPNNTYVKGTEINITFQFYNFNPNICYGYYNYSEDGSYVAKINISESSYNISVDDGYSYNLLGYYRGEKILGNIAYDSSEYKYNGNSRYVTLENSKTSNNTGLKSYGFNSALKGIINITDKDIYSFGDGFNDKPFSFSAWVYLNDSGGGDTVIAKRGNYNEWDFQITGTGYGYPQFSLWDDSTGGRIGRRYITPMGNNEWLFFTGTYNGNKSAGGIKIYLNGIRVDNADVITGSYTAMENTDNKLSIGGQTNYNGLFDGKIDEVTLWNKTLNQSEIIKLYNLGVTNLSHIETIESGELNESENITFHTTFEEEGIYDFKYFVECRGDINVNSSIHLIHFDNDFSNPIITVYNPDDSYNETYNKKIWINFSINEFTYCNINLNNWSLNYSNNYNYSYQDDGANNGYYVLNISCEDLSGNYEDKIITFTKDIIYPIINIGNPNKNNNSRFDIINDEFLINISTIENNDLYLLSFNMTRIPTEDIYYEYIKYISGKNYDYYDYINIENFSVGFYNLNVYVCDSHTNKNEIIGNYKKINDSIEFYFNNNIINIETDDKVKESNVKKEKFKYTFEYEFNDNSMNRKFKVKTNKKLDFIPYKRSGYYGHFVIDDTYYLDFESDNINDTIVKKISDNEYDVYISLKEESKYIKFKSIGMLNCNNKIVKFEIIDSGEESITDIGRNLEFTNTILFYAVFIMVQLIMIFIGLKFRLKWVVILSNLMGISISISFIRFVELNRLFQNSILIYIFINIILIFFVANLKFDE